MGEVPTSVPKTTSSVSQISVADDIIAIEHAPSLVAAQFHGHALRNAGTGPWRELGAAFDRDHDFLIA
jgi:hypothetical protein